MIDVLLKLSKYLESESHFSEASLLQDLLKVASEKDAKYLIGINLRSLRKEFPKGDADSPREYYEMLNQMAEKGPFFTKETIDFVRENIDEDLIPSNRKEFVKWLANGLNGLEERHFPSINDIAMINDWLTGKGWPESEDLNLSNIDLSYDFSCDECDTETSIDVPFSANFFWTE